MTAAPSWKPSLLQAIRFPRQDRLLFFPEQQPLTLPVKEPKLQVVRPRELLRFSLRGKELPQMNLRVTEPKPCSILRLPETLPSKPPGLPLCPALSWFARVHPSFDLSRPQICFESPAACRSALPSTLPHESLSVRPTLSSHGNLFPYLDPGLSISP